MSEPRPGPAPTRSHLLSGTPAGRDRSRGRVRALTVLTTAGTLVGTAGVAWSLAPEATAATRPTAPTAKPGTTRPATATPTRPAAPRTLAPAPRRAARPAAPAAPAPAAPAPVAGSGAS